MDFDAAYATYERLIYHRCLRLVLGCREDAQDLTQRTFLRAWRAWDRRPASDAELAPWLFVIARNEYFDFQRARARRLQTVPLIEGWSVTAPAVASVVERQEEAAEILAAVDTLKAEWRILLWLMALGYVESEISARTGIGRGTIHSRLHRARAELRKRVA